MSLPSQRFEVMRRSLKLATLLLGVASVACGRLDFDPVAQVCDDTACDDDNPCTDDSCTDAGCVHTDNTASCEDGDACTVGDRCVQAVCGSGGATGCGETTKQIFRSVGVSDRDAVATSADVNGTLSISGTTAAFSAALPNQVGVGDVIEYDSNGDGSRDALAFIHGRMSATVFQVRTSTATTPAFTAAPDNTWKIFRAYRSLADAVDVNQAGTTNPAITAAAFDGFTGGRDLVSNNEQWNVACYDDGGLDTAPVQICSPTYTRGCPAQSWRTDTNHVLRIFTPRSATEVGITQRHKGTWATGYRRTSAIAMYEGFVRLDGLSLKRTDAGFGRSYYVETQGGGGEIWISNSFGWNTIPGASKVYDIWDTGVPAQGPTFTRFLLWNDIAYNETTTDPRSGFYLNSNRAEAYVYNCTSYVKGGGAFYQSSESRVTLKNCLGFSELNPAFQADDGFQLVSNSVSNDLSLNGIAAGSNNAWQQSITFLSFASANFHLDPNLLQNIEVRNSGLELHVDPVVTFADDIDGEARPVGATWDIGADQIPP